MSEIQITESLLIDTERNVWQCRSCETDLIDAQENYKKGCLVYERDPTEIHNPVLDREFNFAPDPEWMRIVEFYCPSCGLMIENEYLPPGYPITFDMEVDVETLASPEESP